MTPLLSVEASFSRHLQLKGEFLCFITIPANEISKRGAIPERGPIISGHSF